jgi:hypothetical protein
MSVDRRLLNWGIFLVILGVIPVAVNQGWLPHDTVSRAWQLWPLLLVGSGIGLILARTRLAFLGGLVVAATFGIILGSVIAGGVNLGSFGCGSTQSGTGPVLVDQAGQFGSGATVTLRLDCGSLVAQPSGAGWSVHVTGDQRVRPDVSSAADALTVRTPGGFVLAPFGNSPTAAWVIGLPAGPALDLRVELNATDARLGLAGLTVSSLRLNGNAGSTRLDLSGTKVDSLDIEANAADLRLTLPEGGTTGVVSANAAAVHLCAATGANLRLATGGSTISSDNFASRGLVKNGSTWETAGAASGSPLVDLRLDGNAVSFTLEGPEGCR